MQKTYNTLMIIFSAFVFSSLVYLIVGFALSQSAWKPAIPPSDLSKFLFPIFGLISSAAIVIALRIKRAAFSADQSQPENMEQLQKQLISKSILMFVLSEVPSILGLVLNLLTGNFVNLTFLCALSIVSFLLIKPSREALDELEKRYQLGSR